MSSKQKIVAGIALLAVVVGVAVFALRSPAQTEPEQGVLQSATPPTGQPQSVTAQASSNTTVAAQTAAMVHPEDAIVSEPDSDSETPDSNKPSPEIVNAIREIKKPAPDEGKVTTLPDGSQTLNLGNRYLSVPVATRGKDGKLHVDYHGERYARDNEKTIQQQSITSSTEKQP